MAIHPMAGKISRNVIDTHYYREAFFGTRNNLAPIKFGTSGHRGILGENFSERHVEAVAQGVARFHLENKLRDPILVGGDTRLVSEETAVICAEVLAANGLSVILSDIPLPTPVFSYNIIKGPAFASLNATASHNPPDNMGLKYNPSHGGPAEEGITNKIQTYANEYLKNPSQIKRISHLQGRRSGLILSADLITPYINDLARKISVSAIRSSSLKIGIHPLGGTSIPFFERLIERYNLKNMEIVDKTVDPTFHFIPVDHDGEIRMDPSSEYPMRPLLDLLRQGKYNFVGATDPDADRFGVATKEAGLLSPNHALSIAFDYLINPVYRPNWPKNLGVGRTIGTTHLLDRIAAKHGRYVEEVNVGFKYYVEGLRNDKYALAGEESAGLSIFNWVTEKDGILAVMLLAEIMAITEKDLGTLYSELTAKYGDPIYERRDFRADEAKRKTIKALKKNDIKVSALGGDPVTDIRDTDGIKIYTKTAWILARPSGTEPIVKLYAESFEGPEHFKKIIREGAEIFGLEIEEA
ncbi:MAG: phosphoglucomutase, alpha-D-glucose phosphate-specific [Candidatus Saganbacteria bacterium]|nr:phosphoglucomutase, alpha-D-glucose phosphate-specific [Candidatus Saganbacteria bacterium]